MLYYYCLQFNSEKGVYQCLQMGDNYSNVEFGTITIDYKYSCITSTTASGRGLSSIQNLGPNKEIAIFGEQMVFDWPEHVQVLMMMTLSFNLLGNMSNGNIEQIALAMQEYGINI